MRNRRQFPGWPLTLILLVGICLALPAVPAGAASDQHGQEQAWKGATGRVTVIDFAATWCGPCWKTLPQYQQLAERHPQFQFLVVSEDEEPAGRDRLVRELGLRLPVVWDEDHVIAEHYRLKGMPTTVVLGSDGEVLYRHSGSATRDWNQLQEVLASLPASSPSGGAASAVQRAQE
ncbi:MAG: TlpA disulfide reductase family protein [Acidobacteriota bacterium]|nr:TlpA disulfide reductase family protein [Acidobacteriota bacterium]